MKKVLGFITSLFAGIAAGAFWVNKIREADISEEASAANKFRQYYRILNQWLTLKQEDISFEEYFMDNAYKRIAIYGMGELGNRLYDELKKTSVQVAYAIDSNANGTDSEIEVLGKEEDYPPVDAVIVTAVFAMDEIRAWLCEAIDCPVISLEDVVFGI